MSIIKVCLSSDRVGSDNKANKLRSIHIMNAYINGLIECVVEGPMVK